MNVANGTVKPSENGAAKPTVHKALKITAPGELKLNENATIPHIKADEILVQVH